LARFQQASFEEQSLTLQHRIMDLLLEVADAGERAALLPDAF